MAPLTREKMKWVFTAEYADGTRIEQEDDSCLTRDDGSGSRFTDVLAHPSELVAFHLANNDLDEFVTVDLITGAFIVNGTPLHVHEQHFDPMGHELRLVYFRETHVVQVNDNEGRAISERHFTNRYFIGWETEVGKKTKQVTLAVG